MRVSAAAQMAAIERKMAALPGELEALRKAGAEEVAAEEARIRAIADAERARLLEQARREIDAQLKLAERELTARTADLAVAVAATRVKATITAEDQARLVDQYLGRLAARAGGGQAGDGMTARMSALRYARALLDVALAEADPAVVEQELAGAGGALHGPRGALEGDDEPGGAGAEEARDRRQRPAAARGDARSCRRRSRCSRRATASRSCRTSSRPTAAS